MQRDLINQWAKQSHIKIFKEDDRIISNRRTTKPADIEEAVNGERE